MIRVQQKPLTLGRIGQGLRRRALGLPERAVRAGVPAAWFGWRWVGEETAPEHVARTGRGEIETIHPEERVSNPLPRNVDDPARLPDDAGWWGYAMRDVPTRVSHETFRATLPDCEVISFNHPETNAFWPAILSADRRSLRLREIAFRPGHREALRTAPAPLRLASATWFLERVYHNHSHWLTAHLPKLCLLKERGGLDDLILPERHNPVIDASLRLLGLDPRDFRTHQAGQPLRVDALTLLGTDRFRPELLRPVRDALAQYPGRKPWRRVFISRGKARGRTLVNDADLQPVLQKAGFEPVYMEELSFEEQIRLMGETAVLAAPHGAGLTNMMFCAPGTHVVEIADLSFPNPNFYALACAMGLPYWLVEGRFVGNEDAHPLHRDLWVDPDAVRRVLAQIDA